VIWLRAVAVIAAAKVLSKTMTIGKVGARIIVTTVTVRVTKNGAESVDGI
jgi:hypothetical protein